MGGNIQKEKKSETKKENQQLIDVKEKDLKQNANLGKSRWFYNTQYLSWEIYNTLSEEKKKKIFWIIFPLETSNDIERAYINKFPYEKNGKMIFFDFFQQKHVLIYNQDNSFKHVGLVKRDKPNNITVIKNENNFNTTNNYLYFLDNKINPYQYHLLNNSAMICYENIFSFFNCEMSEDKLIKKFLATTVICTQKMYNFLNVEYQDYIKINFLKYKTNPFSLITLKSMLLFDFKNHQIYLDHFLNGIEEKDFDITIMKMFLEASEFAPKILEFSSNCSKNNVEYTTFYLCLLYILITQKDKDKTILLWNDKDVIEKNNIKDNTEKKDIIKDDKNKKNLNNNDNNVIITKHNDNNCNSNNEETGEVRTYIYFGKENIKNYYENDYYNNNNFLITSKNKFNNIFLYDKEIKKQFLEIEIRIAKKNYVTNLHPLFNMDEFDIGNYSLYNHKNIIFPCNSVFKCLNVDKKNKKVILEFIREAMWNPLLYLTKDNKKLFGILEDGFKFLTEGQRRQVLIARVRNKDVKYIYGLTNLRELEIYDDAEPKTDIGVLTSHFNCLKKLKCLTIVGNNMGNKDCTSLSNGLKFLKELRILNLSFNCLSDNNISKINFCGNNKIEVLNLKSNSGTEISMEIFKNELMKLKQLKELNMLDNQFGDQGLNHLLQVFTSVSDLCILNISNCNITNEGILIFAQFFKKNKNFLEKLEILNLISNPFNDEILSSLIYILKNLPNLKKFSVAQSQLSHNGYTLIYNTLVKEINKQWRYDENGGWFKLVEKDIKEEKKFLNIIKQNETPVVFNCVKIPWLKKNRKKLENKIHFDFSNCNIKNQKLIIDLQKELAYFPNIKILNLSYNDCITYLGYEALSEGFKKLYNLTQLYLSSNNISDKSMEYISNIFEKCKNLSIIDLSINNITNSGFSNFCLNLSKYKIKLSEIDFYSNKIGDEGFKIFCDEANNGTFNNLQKLNVGKNELGNESMKNFSNIFLKCINLEEVNFSHNKLTDEITLYFSQQLNELVDNIQKIDISNNRLSEAIRLLFKEAGLPLNIHY